MSTQMIDQTTKRRTAQISEQMSGRLNTRGDDA